MKQYQEPDEPNRRPGTNRQTEKLHVVYYNDCLMMRSGLEILLCREGYELVNAGAQTGGKNRVHAPDRFKHCQLAVWYADKKRKVDTGQCKLLKEKHTHIKLMAILAEDMLQEAATLVKHGVDYIITSEIESEEVKALAKAITQSKPYMEERCRQYMAEHVFDISQKEVSLLSEREQQVFDLLTSGKSKQETAAAMCLSVKAVDYHLHKMYKKTGTHNLLGLMRAVRG